MPGLSESFFANKSLTLVAAALAFLGAAILISMIVRLALGRGLRVPRNGRTRLPRLGTVDAFDLDRQRQLVIIRRDNVEHLVMIGGPNDLLIELQIIRAESREPRDLRDTRVREKEPPLPAGVAWPASAESPPAVPQRKIPYPPAAAFEPETDGRAGEPVGLSPPAGASAPRPPGFPIPPRRVAPLAAPSNQRIFASRESFQGRAEAPPRSPQDQTLRQPRPRISGEHRLPPLFCGPHRIARRKHRLSDWPPQARRERHRPKCQLPPIYSKETVKFPRFQKRTPPSRQEWNRRCRQRMHSMSSRIIWRPAIQRL